MKLTGLHILLTYECNLECDHCFVWSSPWQRGALSLPQIRDALHQAKDLGTVASIYFEGGEPFLYYPVMLAGVQEAAALGFSVGLVSNGYWGTSEEDAFTWLSPFKGLIDDLSLSLDEYHWSRRHAEYIANIQKVAEELDIPIGVISIAQPEAANAAGAVGQLPPGESRIMYRGRAAVNLTPRAAKHPWETFTACPYENLADPGRVHLDPFGNLHVCQGIVMGNLFERPLTEIVAGSYPAEHPIVGPLLAGGPVGLVETHNARHDGAYADACHLCFETRLQLRSQFPDILTPDHMYGPVE